MGVGDIESLELLLDFRMCNAGATNERNDQPQIRPKEMDPYQQ